MQRQLKRRKMRMMVRLMVTWPTKQTDNHTDDHTTTNPIHYSNSHTTTKPSVSDWQLCTTKPQTDSHTTTKPNALHSSECSTYYVYGMPWKSPLYSRFPVKLLKGDLNHMHVWERIKPRATYQCSICYLWTVLGLFILPPIDHPADCLAGALQISFVTHHILSTQWH